MAFPFEIFIIFQQCFCLLKSYIDLDCKIIFRPIDPALYIVNNLTDIFLQIQLRFDMSFTHTDTQPDTHFSITTRTNTVRHCSFKVIFGEAGESWEVQRTESLLFWMTVEFHFEGNFWRDLIIWTLTALSGPSDSAVSQRFWNTCESHNWPLYL